MSFCRDVDCPSSLCEHGGLCVAVNHRPKCFCPAGFSGPRCEVNVDECASNPCYNGGECVDEPQGYRSGEGETEYQIFSGLELFSLVIKTQYVTWSSNERLN